MAAEEQRCPQGRRGHSAFLHPGLLVWFDDAATCSRALPMLERKAATVLRHSDLIRGLPFDPWRHVVCWDSGSLNHRRSILAPASWSAVASVSATPLWSAGRRSLALSLSSGARQRCRRCKVPLHLCHRTPTTLRVSDHVNALRPACASSPE